MAEILKVEGLSKQFTKKNLFGSKTSVVKAVENVTFTLHDDEVIVIAGESGSGKSTIAKLILRATIPDSGKVIFNGDGSFAFVRKEQKKLKVKGWWTGSKNIKDVAFKYKLSLNNMMKKNYMIGWHHCGILEQWDTAERGDVSSNENGFMDPYENFHTDLTNVMKKVNSKAIELHKNSYKKK